MSTSDGDTACDSITIIDDDVLEGEHSFEIQIASTDPMLSNINSPAIVTVLTSINPTSAMVTVQDNEGSVLHYYGKKFTLTTSYCFLQMQQSHW